MKFQLKTVKNFLQAMLLITFAAVGGCTSETAEERLASAEADLNQGYYATAIQDLSACHRAMRQVFTL